jgi:hypothetical protein
VLWNDIDRDSCEMRSGEVDASSGRPSGLLLELTARRRKTGRAKHRDTESGRESWVGLATITDHGSMDYDYCQGLLLVGIVRMRRAEVEWMEGVGGSLLVW